jgi:chorismate dehydratase
VFAAWVSTKPLTDDFIQLFNETNALGLERIDEIVADASFSLYDLKKYYTHHLSYRLDEKKKQAMAHFLQVIHEDR